MKTENIACLLSEYMGTYANTHDCMPIYSGIILNLYVYTYIENSLTAAYFSKLAKNPQYILLVNGF